MGQISIKIFSLFIDINNYSKNKEQQLKQIDDFLVNVDRLLYDESLLIFFSNEEIDNKLEAQLINKFKKVERLITMNEKKKEDSLFQKKYSTIYICRNFTNNKEIYLKENYFYTKNFFLGSIIKEMKMKNMRIFDAYVNSSDTFEFCLSNKLSYFGICTDMNTYTHLEKVVDLTPYINNDFINYCTSFDIKEVYILKNNILTFDLENDKAFLLKVDDKTNDDFNPVKLDSDIISKISNLCIKAKDFKIWAYDGEIKLFYNKKLHNYDNTYKDCLSKQKFENYYNYFNTNISDKERIDFSLSDIDSSIFDIYKLNNNGTYQFYLAHSKSNKNQQVAIRVKLQE